ncbi:hypothetical protein [Bradyrhizobium amphicarpaeae]|uniref:hypothetical protein n=1 Tax=Bradyrhizobium amphicarpaeae TaxID=1404768 RepID=UPI0011E4D191|nr:hypothetical protein [Bradyrhizobium amphicarpaeae]
MVAFTLLVGIACIIALASTLTQSRILSLNFDGVQASIWKLDSVRRDWSELRGRNLKQTGALQAATTEKLELNDQQAAASQRLNQYKEQLFVRLAEIAARIKETDGPLHDAIGGDADLKTRAAALAAAESRLRTNLPDLGPILDNFGKERQQYSEALTKMSDLDSQSSSLAQKQKYLAQGLLEIGKNIDVVFSQITKNVDAPTHAKIENALYELDPSSGWFSLIINRFVILQPDVLALVLVVLMGLLGSSLQILHSLFRAHRIESPGDYILQLSVGAITALVIFIVAKAGVPIIADASRLSGDAPINPYFVSFLAIISGLLSEQAIITVQNQGRRIFATGKAEPDRWVRVSLDPTLNDQNLTVEQLASYLSVPTDAANSIIKGESKADAEQQKAIAIFLRKSVRDLFTDMPPANVSDS